MSDSIHGHDVMQMMITSDKAYTKESLRADIVSKFGQDARFHTCSAQNMDAEQLIAFLEARGKFSPQDEGFKTDPDKICNH